MKIKVTLVTVNTLHPKEDMYVECDTFDYYPDAKPQERAKIIKGAVERYARQVEQLDFEAITYSIVTLGIIWGNSDSDYRIIHRFCSNDNFFTSRADLEIDLLHAVRLAAHINNE